MAIIFGFWGKEGFGRDFTGSVNKLAAVLQFLGLEYYVVY
jgi:hypothetical protein